MDKFLDLLAQSTIVQGVVTVLLVGTCSALWLQAQPVPSELLVFTGAVLGYWFGTKSQMQINRITSKLRSVS